MNPYTSMWTGITDADGPQTFHLVLIDNGRTDTLADEVGRQALRCIRCSACLNVCPVYERVSVRLRLGLPRPDRRDPQPPTPGHRKRDRRLPPVRLLALRRLLRGLPGRHRHPGSPRPPARTDRRGRTGDTGGQQGRAQARQGARRRAGGDAGGTLGVQPPRRPAHRSAARLPDPPLPSTLAARPRQGVERHQDLPAVPAEPFRDWWQRTHGGKDTDK